MAKLYGWFSILGLLILSILQYAVKLDATVFAFCFCSLVAVYALVLGQVNRQ